MPNWNWNGQGMKASTRGVVLAVLVAASCSSDGSTRVSTSSHSSAKREGAGSSSSSSEAGPVATAVPTTTCATVAAALMAHEPALADADIDTADQRCVVSVPTGSIEFQRSGARELDLALAGALDSKSATVIPETGIGAEAGFAVVGSTSAVAWKMNERDAFTYVLVARSAGSRYGLVEGQLVDLAVAASAAL